MPRPADENLKRMRFVGGASTPRPFFSPAEKGGIALG